MKLSFVLIILISFPIIFSVTFDAAMANLKILESYISQYKTEKSSTLSLNQLILGFIRQGKYDDTTWTLVGGNVPKDLLTYIQDQDVKHNTKSLECRSYGDILLPTNKKFDFVHLFAVMNGMDFLPSSSTLVGWGGDLAQLAQDLKNNFKDTTDLDKLIVEAKKFLGIKGQFGEGDLNADIDAPLILRKKKLGTTFAATLQNYYANGEYLAKIRNFVSLTFPEVKSKEELREAVFNKYGNDAFIKILECKYGLRAGGSILKCYSPKDLLPQFVNHQKAAVYAFADYLSDNYY